MFFKRLKTNSSQKFLTTVLNSRLKERNSYEKNLQNAGADLILNSIYDLSNINLYEF